jgi:hypothetical protein
MLKTQIRDGVFETNSSSSHSVTIDRSEVIAIDLPKDVLREGVLRVQLSSKDYGWGWTRFRRPENKIAYMLIQYAGGYLPSEAENLQAGDDHADIFRENVRCAWFLSTIERATGCRIEVTRETDDTTWGYVVDHQSIGNGVDEINDDDDILRLVFGKNSFIETGNDNDARPEIISNDLRGKEQYFQNIVVGSVPDGDRFLLREENGDGWSKRLVYTSEDDLLYTPNITWEFRKAVRELLQHGDVVVEGFNVTMSCGDRCTDSEFAAFARRTAFETWVDLFEGATNLRLLQDFVLKCHRKDYVHNDGQPSRHIHDWDHKRQAEVSIVVVAKDDTARKLEALLARAHEYEAPKKGSTP